VKKLIIILSLVSITQCKESKSEAESKSPKTDLTREIPQGLQIGFLNLEGGISNSMEFVLSLKKYLAAPNVKGLLLRINSGGGAPAASWHIYNELVHFRKFKPVVVLVENMAASGAYWAACGGNIIITAPVAELGSIGAYLRTFTQKNRRINSKDGICAEIEPLIISAGKYKAANVEGIGYSKVQADHQRKLLDQLYEEFYTSVARERKLDLDKKEEWAEGREFIGTEAIKIGLADKIGSITDAEQALLEIMPKYRMTIESKNIIYMQPDGKVLPYDKIQDSEESCINTAF
jgi:protease IV